MKRGEVWWSEHPVYGPRPTLVLTRDEAIARLNEVLVVPLTRTIRKIPTEVELDAKDGMPQTCVLTLDNVGTLAKGLLVERLTTLSAAKMAEVCRALAAATNC